MKNIKNSKISCKKHKKCIKSQSADKKCEKFHIGLSLLQKRVFWGSKNEPKMMPKVRRNARAGGKTRMEK